MTPPLWRRLLRRRSISDTAMRPSRFRVRPTVVPLCSAGQSGPRDLCPTGVHDLQAIAYTRMLVAPPDPPLQDRLYFHARWCALGRMRSGPEPDFGTW